MDDLDTYLEKYGTETASRLLKSFAQRLRDKGEDVNVADVNEVADALHLALQRARHKPD